jgi:hypothetical protein
MTSGRRCTDQHVRSSAHWAPCLTVAASVPPHKSHVTTAGQSDSDNRPRQETGSRLGQDRRLRGGASRVKSVNILGGLVGWGSWRELVRL